MEIFFSKSVPKYMRVYAHFCAHHLELNKLRGTIDVHLSRGTLEGDAYGLCWGDNREAEIHIGSIQWGKPIPNEDKLKTLGHEMVHARQYLRRELIPRKDGIEKCQWKGEECSFDMNDEENEPWEVEARMWEDKLHDGWIELLDSKKITRNNIDFLGVFLPV
jgi:hypothetical protein